MGGLGLMDTYIQLGTRQIESFLTNTWQKTPTGMLIELAVDEIMLEMGVQSPIASKATLKKGL